MRYSENMQVMKQITGKQKENSSSLPKAIKTKQGITKKEMKIA